MKKISQFYRGSVALILVSIFFLFGCGTWMIKIDREKMPKIEKVAVVMYTVPEVIEYRNDPKDKPAKDLLDVAVAVAQQASKGDGVKAATISHGTFSSELNKQGLSFKVITQKQLFKNKEYTALYKPPEEEKKAGLLGNAMSMLGGSTTPKGASPENINMYGLSQDAWDMNSALMGSDEEKKYLKSAIQSLDVDGIIVVHDTGYSFSCKGCAGPSGGPMTGVASTASRFIATLLDKDLKPVINMKEYFVTTPASAPMAANIILTPLHEKLFKAHGQKMAEVFADAVKKELEEKE